MHCGVNQILIGLSCLVQLELRILAHLAKCKSMKEAFKAGGDFHSRTAMNMYDHVWEAVEKGRCLLEWEGPDKPPVPLLKVCPPNLPLFDFLEC